MTYQVEGAIQVQSMANKPSDIFSLVRIGPDAAPDAKENWRQPDASICNAIGNRRAPRMRLNGNENTKIQQKSKIKSNQIKKRKIKRVLHCYI